MKKEITVNSINSLDSACLLLSKLFSDSKYLTLRIDTGKPRSLSQNAALHKYCTMLADALNESGQYLIIKINGKESEIPWVMETVKQIMWRPIQQAITQKKSTTEPSTKEYPYIYEVLNRYTAEKLGIYVPWPSKEQSQ